MTERSDPFQGDSATFEVHHPIALSQLQSEIGGKVGKDVQVALSVDDIHHVPSSDRPAVLFVSPGGVDTATVRDVIAAHQPVEEGTTPSHDEVADRLRAGETLNLTEVSVLLRALLDD
jgi:hypothetical protein